jgi:glycosyltransferase involved in cell wall biosynthesis
VKKVLFMVACHTVGGVESRQHRLAKLLPGRGWHPVFALTRGNRFHRPERFRSLFPDLDTVILDGRTGTLDGRLIAVRKAVRRVRPDVVIPGALWDAFTVLSSLKSGGRAPRLVYCLPGVQTPALTFLRRHRQLLDSAFGVSRLTCHLLESVCGLLPERVHYVATGVTPARTVASRTPGEPLRIGYVGRFDPDKRALDFAELCRNLDARGVRYRAVAVGAGTLDGALREAVAPWVASGAVRVLPHMPVEALYESVYPRLDACVLFSASEGLPNTQLEAMAHGVVPVSSDYVGRAVEGLVEDDVTGLVFPVGDTAAAAGQLARLAADPALHERLAEKARRHVELRHRPEHMADSFVRTLDSALARPADPRGVACPGSGVPSRLGRLVGSVAAEWARRLLGRRYLHRDASEWPLIDNYVDEQTVQVAGLIERALCRAPAPVPVPAREVRGTACH